MTQKLENYILKISQKEPELLQRLSRETHQKVLHARMLSGALQGRILSMLSKLIHPQTILEIGTFTGYSTLCLAEGLMPNGKLHTIDRNEELVTLQKKYFEQSKYNTQIIQHTGNALDILPYINEKLDMAFIDADKKNYNAYADMIIPKLNPGGVLISDNVLWYGKVLHPTKKGDQDTAILKEFNLKRAEDPRLENVLLPIRDGLLISRKI